jgi:anti-sigma factor (TIGR02949 family)
MSIDPLETAMDCSELGRAIDAFLDGEFDARERAEAEAHVAGCPRCRTAVDRRGHERAALRARLQSAAHVCAPAALRERVEASLSRVRRPLWRRALSPVPIAALTACAAGALVVLSTHTGDGALVEEAIRYHHRALPLEADAAAMPDWFRGKLDFRFAPPQFAAAGVRLEGGRLSNIREWPAAYIRYQLPTGHAGLFVVDDPGRRFDAPGREVRVGPEQVVRLVAGRGYNVAVWREDEIVYSLVSDLGEEDLFHLVQTARAERSR